MSNTLETIAAVGRTSEEEINFMLGDQEFDIDGALQEAELQEEEGPQMDWRAKAATFNPNGGDFQTSIIDAALEDLEDDLKFDGITFDQQHQDFTMPAITGYASMGMPTGFNSGLNFDNFQYNIFNYPPPPPGYNTMHNTTDFYNSGFYNTGFNNNGFNNNGFQNISFHNTTMPMFHSNSTSRFSSDWDFNRIPLSRASMQARMFSSDAGGDHGSQYPSMAMKGNFPSYPTMQYDGMSTFDLGGNGEPTCRGPFKKRRVDKTNFGSPVAVVGPSQGNTHMLTEETAYGPFHLVAIKECAILDMGEAAVAARKARKIRRMKRAKAHILHLLDTSVSEIENAAVSDADYDDPYDLGLTQDEQCEHLLRDYTDNFDAKTFVEGLWDGIYVALSSAAEKPEVEVQADELNVKAKAIVNDGKATEGNNISVAENLIQLMRRKPGFSVDAPDDNSGGLSSSIKLKRPNINANVSCNPDTPKTESHDLFGSKHIVTPTASDVARGKKRSLDGSNISHTAPFPLVPSNLSSKTKPCPPAALSSSQVSQQGEMYADLPDGNDEESRRLRRLMRNRLSAQRSRDKRRRDIELYTRLKAQRVEEIASTKKALTEEKEGLKKLEEIVNFAKTFLGPEKFTTVVSN